MIYHHFFYFCLDIYLTHIKLALLYHLVFHHYFLLIYLLFFFFPLVNLLLQAELGNYDFFENEIISIKRNIRFEKQTYITEKLIFKFIQGYPLPSYEKARNKRWLQYQKDIQKIEQDKYERQLLKTFDVLAWIESKLTQRSLADIFAEKAH